MVLEEGAPFPGPFSDPPLASSSINAQSPLPKTAAGDRLDGAATKAHTVKADALGWIPGTHGGRREPAPQVLCPQVLQCAGVHTQRKVRNEKALQLERYFLL